MRETFLYKQKIIVIKQKNSKNIQKMFDIFFTSLEKYKNYLKFIKQEEGKNNNKNEDRKNNNLKILISENINKIEIKYKINQNNENYNNKNEDGIDDEIKYKKNVNDNKIKIFGETFVKNNKNKCYIINGKIKYNLNTYFYIKERKGKSNKKIKFKIKLVGIMNINNLEEMFSGCSSLESLPDISKWNTNNVTDMRALFYNCSSIQSLPDISKWNTNNVTNMNSLFYNCSSIN